MYITLNIGLAVSKNYMPEGVAEMKLQYEYVKEYLEKVLGTPAKIELAHSNTEQTVVVQYKNVERTLHTLFDLAAALKQDCIAYAVYDDDATMLGGALMGKFAHEWDFGFFDSQYFIEVM